MKKYFSIIALFFIPFLATAQLHVNFSGEANYWQHTDLYGGQAGIGLEYRKGKKSLRTAINFGYGEYDRLKNFDLEYNIPYQTFSIEGTGKVNSDFARQLQFDLLGGYKLIEVKEKFGLWVNAGLFTSRVTHLYIIDAFNTTAVIDVPRDFVAIVYSRQQFYTIGGQLELAAEWKRGNTFFSPYVRGGVGPNYTSFATIGMRVTGTIQP
jgi:hypothetical protein